MVKTWISDVITSNQVFYHQYEKTSVQKFRGLSRHLTKNNFFNKIKSLVMTSSTRHQFFFKLV